MHTIFNLTNKRSKTLPNMLFFGALLLLALNAYMIVELKAFFLLAGYVACMIPTWKDKESVYLQHMAALVFTLLAMGIIYTLPHEIQTIWNITAVHFACGGFLAVTGFIPETI